MSLLLLGLPVSVGAQPVTLDQDVLNDSTTLLVQQQSTISVLSWSPPGQIGLSRSVPADTVTRWSGRGQVGMHWTEGARDVVLLMAQHDLLFQDSPYEVYASVSGTASWTDIFRNEADAQTQHLYRYALDLHGQRALSSRTHAVATIVWLRDPSQGIQHQLYTGAGATQLLRQRPAPYTLRAQATGGYLREREVSGEHLDVPAALMALNLALRFADGGHLSFHAEAIDNLSEPEDLLLRLRGRVTAPLGAHVGLTISADLTHDLLPAATYVEEDATGTMVSITPASFSAFLTTGISIQW